MMKKIFLLILGFVMFKVGYSQYPIQQYIGADSAVVTSKGGLQGRLINQVFVDTTAANSQRIKQYPGAMVYASGKLWVRNTTATGWTELAYGPISTTNIYNSDGSLTGNRQLDGNGYSLAFNSIGGEFGVGADSIALVPSSGKFRVDLNSGAGTKALRYNPVTRLFSYADTTSSPTGSGTTNYLSKWTSSSVLGNSLVFDNGTNVGINTATPSASYKLDVSGNVQIVNSLATTTLKLGGGGIYTGTIDFGNSYISQTSTPILTVQSNAVIDLSTNFATRLRITSSGRVLIGTTTESTYELDVVGDIRSTLDANINGLTVGKGGGSVATNTAVGFEALNATNTGGFNVAIGYRALKAYTGDSNVAIGTNALTANTTGNTNVGIGSGAGQAITTANKNTLVGYAAGSSNVSSHGNTYIGYAAGISATANANTLVGSEAGYNMSNAAQNTFVGNAAGRAVTTGGTNTLVGYFSGYSLSTGSENVLIGNNIMASASTASQNTIVGSYAGNQLTGNANAYFGWYAGVSATSSVYNTGIGYGALQNIITGSNNTAIGFRAGRFFGAATSSNTTGANGIFVGYQSRASADGNTNETVIGYDLIGNGSNTVTIGNSSVTATYLGGSVSTSQPSATGAGKWKLGKKISATVALVTTDYIEVDIDGVVYKLALVN